MKKFFTIFIVWILLIGLTIGFITPFLDNNVNYITENTISSNIIEQEDVKQIENNNNFWWYDYPISHIITIGDEKIFTTEFKELVNEKDSLWAELECFEYMDLNISEKQKTCVSGGYIVEELDFNK